MYIFKVLFVVLLFLPSSLWAQLTFSELDERARTISNMEDVNEKKFRLAEFAKTFKSFLLVNSTSIKENPSHYIKTTKSSDSKYTIYYFNTFNQDVIYRIDWFVLYGDIKGRKVIHSFDDKIKAQLKKGNGELQLSLAKLVEENINLYPLTFSFKSDRNTYKEFRDIASICMFEELLNRETAKERLALNDSIIKRLNVLWKNPELFEDKFEGLKRMSTLISDDSKAKVCTWNVLMPNSTNKFFGVVVAKNRNGIKVQALIDGTHKVRSVQRAALSPRKWLGAIYYDIISVKDNSYGTYYLLLGYKPNNEMTKKKVVECMLVVGNGQVRFGHSVFQVEKTLNKRLVFEYNAATNMMMRYEKNNNRIVLDHLAPPSSVYEGNTRFYGPDFSYDAYVFQKGKWVLQTDVDVFNPKNQ